jgi:serine protease Do
MTPAADDDPKGRIYFVMAAVLLLGILLGTFASGLLRPTRVEAGSPAPLTPAESPFVRVAEEVLPGVVSVEARRFFHHPEVESDSTGDMELPFPGNGEILIPSSGSGFLIDDVGHILTNNHVVAGASAIWVHLADGRRLQATLVGTDPPTDVAVLKVEANGTLPTVPLGDSDALRIGEWVAAVGNPLGVLEGTLTVGVVSAKKRNEIEISGSSPAYQDFIQTDAAINFGNSGGPLVNTRGEAVGINTAFGGPGRGIGFAVSINMAKEVARSLIEEGKVSRGYMGVVLQRLDPVLAKGLGLSDANGVLLRDVQPQMPAEQAGLKAGDVIVSFDGLDVHSLADFRLQVARTRSGASVPVRYYREGRETTVHVNLTERPNFDDEPAETPPPPPAPTDLGLGLAVLPDSDRTAVASGVLISDITDGGIAEEAGLEQGDFILQVNGRNISSPDSCLRVLRREQAASHPAVLRMQRGNDRWFVALPFGESLGELEEPDR